MIEKLLSRASGGKVLAIEDRVDGVEIIKVISKFRGTGGLGYSPKLARSNETKVQVR